MDVLKQQTITTELPVSEGAGKWRGEGVPEGHSFLFLTSHSIPSLSFQDAALKLKEAEEAQSTLQAECEQYRTILAETVSCSLGCSCVGLPLEIPLERSSGSPGWPWAHGGHPSVCRGAAVWKTICQ